MKRFRVGLDAYDFTLAIDAARWCGDVVINSDGEEVVDDTDDERGSTELQLEITKSDPDKKLIPTEDPNQRRLRKLKEAGYVGL